ncbi:MAG: hypothetical protein ACT4PU_11520 [Planctomycetota bacterium]
MQSISWKALLGTLALLLALGPAAATQSFMVEASSCTTGGTVGQCFFGSQSVVVQSSSPLEGAQATDHTGNCPAWTGGSGPEASVTTVANVHPDRMTVAGTLSTNSCLAAIGGSKGYGYCRTRVSLPGIVFSGTPAQTGSVVNVGLPAVLLVSGANYQNVSVYSTPSAWTQGAPPMGSLPAVNTWTASVPVTLGSSVSVEVSLDVYLSALQPHPTSAHVFLDLQLGDPELGTLFELPPGITANAPSIGLVDNVLGGVASPWSSVAGTALAGTAGKLPQLQGVGALTPSSAGHLSLSNALELTTSTLIVGITQLNAPFKGGVMVPDPLLFIAGLPTNSIGELGLSFTWPTGVPAGFDFYFQHWIVDGGGPLGFSASNGLVGTSQL